MTTYTHGALRYDPNTGGTELVPCAVLQRWPNYRIRYADTNEIVRMDADYVGRYAEPVTRQEHTP